MHTLSTPARHWAIWLFLALCFIGTANASQSTPYSEALFSELQKKGELVLVDIGASWCSTCAKQKKVISDYQAAHPNIKLHVLSVDFDKQKDLVRQFRAPRQSTLLLYKGERQFWYSVAETRPEVIFAEFNKAANAK